MRLQLFDPYTAIRTVATGEGYRFAYIGSGNEGDAIRGRFFLDAHDLFPSTFFVGEPPQRAEHPCFCRIVRNPTPAYAGDIAKPGTCGCRLIIDVSGPFWDGTVFCAEDLDVTKMDAWRSAVRRAASMADLVTLPDADYARHLTERYGLKTAVVPDFDADRPESVIGHMTAWTTAILAARAPRVPA